MLYVWKCWSVFRLYLEKFKIRVPPCEKSFYIQIKVGFIYTFWFTISSTSLHRLINHFIYKIFTRITALDESTFLNPAEQFIFISLHSPKFIDMVCYLEWDTSFSRISFELQQQHNWSHSVIWVTIWVAILVVKRTRSELTRNKCK